MNSIRINLEKEIEDLFNNLIIKGNIELNKLNSEKYSKGIIRIIYEFISIYINLSTYKRHYIWRNINYLNHKLRNHNLKKFGYKFSNKKIIKNIFLLFYLMIFQISISKITNVDFALKFFINKKLFRFLKIMTAFTSKFYIDKLIDISELGIILKMLIAFSVNNTYEDIKVNTDIKNLMYFKECISIILITFKENHDENEQKFLINIFNYINTNICFQDKEKLKPNYTNKFYLLHNDYKTTKLIKLMNFIYKINNKELTKIYFTFLINIYYFQFSYNNLAWNLYELIQPLLENIDIKNYETILKEIAFPEFQFCFIKELMEKEKEFIKGNDLIFKNAFYLSGKQINSGIIADIGKIKEQILLSFGFNLIITDIQKEEYIIFQIKTYEQKLQLKATIIRDNKYYFLCLFDSHLNKEGLRFKLKINPNHYYSFVLNIKKGKLYISYLKEDEFFEEPKAINIKEMKTNNLLLCMGCEIEKINLKSNLIHNNYIIKNMFSGFIGDIFIININSYKDEFSLQNNILNLKGKYGYTFIKSALEQKSLDEYVSSNLDKTSKNITYLDDKENLFTKKYPEKRKFKIIENTELYINSNNFRLVEYIDNIDYMNYDNKYYQKKALSEKTKKVYQFLYNLRTKASKNDNKIIEIGSSLFNCNFNYVDNTSSIIKFIEEDGIFYMLLILEYYYQILFRLCKDVLSDNKKRNKILSYEQEEILKLIEKGIEDFLEFFYGKMKETSFNIKIYKKILFFYQINVVIKQFILLKNINDNIFDLLIKFMHIYQDLLKQYIKTGYDEDKNFYKMQRNFFFDFLLNPAFYVQKGKLYSLKNLNRFLDSAFGIIKNNISIEELFTENILEKIFHFTFIFSYNEGENNLNKNEDKIIESYEITKAKYLHFMINYFTIGYSDSNKNTNFIKMYCQKLFNYENNPIIFYYLSLILYLSPFIKDLQPEFLEKMEDLFEDNYTLKKSENIIYSVSSMLILNSYYLVYFLNNSEKLQNFKFWFAQLHQNFANSYFIKIYNLIYEGAAAKIKDVLLISPNIIINKEKNILTHEKFFDKKRKEIDYSLPLNLSIQKNILPTISLFSGYEIEKSSEKKVKNDENNDDFLLNNIKEFKQNRIDPSSKQNIKINIKINIEENNLEIEKIKNAMNNEKYFNTYFCFLDDIKQRCFLYNPKNVLIKRLFSHIFYKSLFHCKAFMLIKNIYLNTFHQANMENKQLNYPSKLKNFSNVLEPKLFLKKDCHIFYKKYFRISHDNLFRIPPIYKFEDENKKKKMEALIASNVSEIKFYEHRFNINDILEEKERYFNCELVNPQFTYFGFIFLGNNYLYFGTKYEKPINLRQKEIKEFDLDYFSKYCFSYRCKENESNKLKTFIIFYQDIKRIIKRRSFLMYQSLEIFCQNGKSYFLNLFKKENCEIAFKILKEIRDNLSNKDKFELINENTSEEIKKINNEVKHGNINNFVYLLKLNYLASRTYNELNQYPVFPWIFFDMDKIDSLLNIEKNNISAIESTIEQGPLLINQENDLENNEIEKQENINAKLKNEDLTKNYQLRNFTYPISLQTEEKREKFFESEICCHGTHYSTASFIYFYLSRNYPFTELIIQLQNLQKENPNRLFYSLKDFLSSMYITLENRESCPEFFAKFDFYCNLNCSFNGFQHNNLLVDDVMVDKINNTFNLSGNLYSIYFKYVYILRRLLNSFLISKFLPNWIDYTFGVKQIEKSKSSFYSFNKTCYEDKLKLDKKLAKYIKRYKNNEEMSLNDIRDKINIKIDFLNNFGIIPHRVLNSSIKLRTAYRKKKLTDEYLEINKNCYFKKVDDNNILILFKIPKNVDKAKNIYLWNYNNILIKNKKDLDKKNLFNCGHIKTLEKVALNNSIKIPIFKPCYSMSSFFMLNKLFILTCRYLGNIFKVQNRDYCIDVFCEDFVSCISCRKAYNSDEIDDVIIYSGLRNGKFIEWIIKQDSIYYTNINIKERNNYHFHKGEINCIEIYQRQNVLITAGEDKMIFIRKTYDFELLTAINLTYCYMNPIIRKKINITPTLIKVSDLNCIYVLLHNYDTDKSFIRGYNLNGLFFKQSKEDYFMNICITKNCNLLVSYYNKNEINILNCYDFEPVKFSISIPKFVENIEKIFNKKIKKNQRKDDDDKLIWNEYDYKNHELILLFDNKILRGNLKDKEEQTNIEFY